MNRTRGVYLSALGLLALMFFCPPCRRNPIEQSLKEQSEAVLKQAGLQHWSVAFKGLDAELFGGSPDEARQARALIAEIPGVQAVTLLSGSDNTPESASTPEPVASPEPTSNLEAIATPEPSPTPPEPSPTPQERTGGEPTGLVQLVAHAGTLYVRGVYPDEASRQSALQAAQSAFGTGAVRDETTLSGTSGTLGWPEEILKSLVALQTVRNLELSAGGDAVTLAGTVASADEKKRLAKLLKASLPENITLENHLTLAGEKLAPTLPPDSAALPPAERRIAQQTLNTVVASGEVLFATASSRIRPEAYLYLNKVAETLKNQTGATVVVGGHTDNQGDEPNNRRLSQKRADSVRAYLVARGIPVKHVYAQGYGSAQPIATNTTEEGRRRNRRIGFVVR